MKHIYYVLAILPIMWEIINLMHAKKVHGFIKEMKSVKKSEGREYDSTQNMLMVLMMGYTVWGFIGLFTFQWPVFLFMFLLGLWPYKTIWWRKIDALISLVLLFFATINTYHLQIDVYQWILNKL